MYKNLKINNPLNLNLKFIKFKIKVISLLLQDIKSFERFCFNAISNNLSKEEIADITNLRVDIVEERINFLISHKYFEEKNGYYKTTNKGEKIIEHIEIVNYYEKNPIYLVIDKTGKNIFNYSQLSNFFEKQNNNDLNFPEKTSSYKIEFENDLNKEIKDFTWNLIDINHPKINNKEEINIIYDFNGNYTLSLEFNYKDILFLRCTQNEKSNLFIPCIQNRLNINFSELDNLDEKEKTLLENFNPQNIIIIEKLIENGFIEKKENNYVLTESGLSTSNLIKWLKEYNINPTIINYDLVWGQEINDLELLSNIIKNKKVLSKRINLNKDDISLSNYFLEKLIEKKEMRLPKTLLTNKFTYQFETKYLALEINNKWVINKVNKITNTPCGFCNDKIKVVCNICFGKKELKPFEKCSYCQDGLKKCSCNNGYNNCLYCSGTGKILICKYCSGSAVCPKCLGKSRIRETCPNCTGKGKVYFFFTCTLCNGSGKYLPPICSYCEGNGVCSTCKGNASKDCDVCKAIGKTSCRYCNEKGELKCNHCSGIGFFPQVICKNCDENGLVICKECIYNQENLL